MAARIGVEDYGWLMGAVIPGLLLMLVPFVILAALVLFLQAAHSSSRQIIEAASDLKLESDLQREFSRSKSAEAAPTWDASELPASVIAAIWPHRFVGHPTQPPTKTQRYEASLRRMSWGYGREAPYILATDF